MDKKISSVGSLKTGSYVLLDGVACTVKSLQTSRPGKHGHAKCRIEATGMIDGQKKIVVMPAHDKIDIPIIQKRDAQVLSVQGDHVNVMDMETFETIDLKIPENLKDSIKENETVVYWVVMQDKLLKQIK